MQLSTTYGEDEERWKKVERTELITHLEHLAEYVKYSEDAPALREAIALLKTHKERTETHACDCISRRESTMGQVNESAQSTNDLIIRKAEIDPKDAVSAIENLSSAQPDHIVEVSKKVECPTFEDSSQYAQPDNRLSKIAELVEGTIDHFDLDDAMDLLYQIMEWIPCSERLPDHPENNDYYLVTIQCEHHDGWDDYVTGFAEWTKYGWDELSYYIGQIKVIAWMPLPEPYKERREK